jgi:hypothetical protein
MPSQQVVVAGTTVLPGTGSTSVVTVPSRPPKVVVSEPSGSRFPWRRPDPDGSLITTRVEGALDDQTTNR